MYKRGCNGAGEKDMDVAYTHVQALGEAETVWFKLSMLSKQDDPMQALLRMSEKYGGCIRINLRDERIFFLSDPDHFKQVLVGNAERYGKYFDGLKPIFGKSMITVDGALWQKIRMPQQAAFQPKMYGEYLPYLLASVQEKAAQWAEFAAKGETVNLLEETWSLAANMICKALFDRDVPFNPHVVFSAVKSYTDVLNHKKIRLQKVKGELTEVPSDEAAADAIGKWLSVPPMVLGAVPRDHREQTLLSMMHQAMADPAIPEFDEQQVMDEMKQYLWAGTETTALTLAWCFYLLSLHPEIAERIRREGEQVYGDRVPTWEDIHGLNYTRSVIQETMRLYPPVWSLIRQAVDRDELAGYQVEPGDKMVMCTYIAHHSPRFWKDPERFDPERFSPENAKKRAKYSYLPFGAGKRSCIGGALSLVENTLALTQLLRRFRPEYVGEVPARISATVTLTPAGGTLPFRIHNLS